MLQKVVEICKGLLAYNWHKRLFKGRIVQNLGYNRPTFHRSRPILGRFLLQQTRFATLWSQEILLLQ